MEILHNHVRDLQEIESEILKNVDIAEWTIGGKTLLHTAVEAHNLKALEQLIGKVFY